MGDIGQEGKEWRTHHPKWVIYSGGEETANASPEMSDIGLK
jgi:hypothetical protein